VFPTRDVHVFDISGRILVLALLPLLLLYFKTPEAILSYMALLESLDKSPEMNNRCLICAIVLVLSQGQRT
jgi:hypothetical protein